MDRLDEARSSAGKMEAEGLKMGGRPGGLDSPVRPVNRLWHLGPVRVLASRRLAVPWA